MSYIAIDIGASSGRHIVCDVVNEKMELKEIYRFPNNPTRNNDGSLIWDINYLFKEIKNGLKKAHELNIDVEYVGIDTWAVDYVLLDKDDKEIGEGYCYRDERGKKASELVHKIIPFKELYSKTGIQFQPFNTIYQLYDDKLTNKIKDAQTMLMLPDYFDFKLTGIKKQEYTNATSTGLVNCLSHNWDVEILDKLGINKNILLPLSQPGSVVGKFSKEIEEELGYSAIVLLPATHDTASAVIAAPIEIGDAYISSGTWSLLGVEEEKAHSDEKSMSVNYSNEGDLNYYFRYQKNIMGLWIIQQVRHELNDAYSFGQLADMARNNPTDKVIDVNDESFLAPTSMIKAIEDKVGHLEIGELAYCVYNSLALSYKEALEELETLTNKKFNKLNIIGGGTNNILLNELTKEKLGIDIITGPTEGSAIGNFIMQLIATGKLKDINEARKLVTKSFEIKTY